MSMCLGIRPIDFVSVVFSKSPVKARDCKRLLKFFCKNYILVKLELYNVKKCVDCTQASFG